MTNQNKPVTQVLVDYEERQSLGELINTLETIAAKLREEGKFTLMQGKKEIVIQPSDRVKTELKYEVKGDKHSFEIEFEWYPGQGSQKMKIL